MERRVAHGENIPARPLQKNGAVRLRVRVLRNGVRQPARPGPDRQGHKGPIHGPDHDKLRPGGDSRSTDGIPGFSHRN